MKQKTKLSIWYWFDVTGIIVTFILYLYTDDWLFLIPLVLFLISIFAVILKFLEDIKDGNKRKNQGKKEKIR